VGTSNSDGRIVLLTLRRKELKLGVTVRSVILTTIPDSTSQKFLLLGTSPRGKGGDGGRHALVFLDFAPLKNRQCSDKDFEKWYARSAEGKECLMGHKVSNWSLYVASR
jgi:hypothetical protein